MLKIQVQNQIHEIVREFVDEEDNTFLNYCRAARGRGVRHIDFIDPYADAMWNYIQLDDLSQDLRSDIVGGVVSERERKIVEQVLEAIAEARSLSGYVQIVGD